MLAMEALEKDICSELLHSLHEWGVNPSNREHVKFRQRVIRDCVANLSKKSKEPINYKALTSERFPKNYNDAYKHVLLHDEVLDKLYSGTDSLSGMGYPEPFFIPRIIKLVK